MISREIGPVAAVKKAIVVKRLPKTRSSKVLRSTIQKTAEGESFPTPGTIEDPTPLSSMRSERC